MFTRRSLALTTIALAISAGVPLAATAQTKILFNSFLQPAHPINTQVFTPWAEDVAKATEGRVKIEIPPSSLAAPPQQMDSVSRGVVDMAYQFHGFLENRVKLTQIASLMGVNSSAKGSSVALWQTYEKYFASANEYKDVHVLGLFVFSSGKIFGMKESIDKVSDLKGVKAFGLPGVAATVLEAAGAGVVAAPAVRSYEIIAGGTVDLFAGYSLIDANAFKTLQYAKHIVDLPGGMTAPSFVFFVNKKKWELLSAADREAISKLSGQALSERMAVFDQIEAKIRADAIAQGIQIKNASPAFASEMLKLAAPIEAAWLRDAKALGVDGPAALAFYKQQAASAK
jgi:TRAP-type C4-dicarboxylate transport system substrate-binding protein